MNTKFVFDKKTGTMKPANEVVKQQMEEPKIVQQPTAKPPQFQNERSVDVTPQFANYRVDDDKLEKLREYAIELGLDGILLFRSQTDYTICQITDERTGRVMAYIGGYDLNIKFNMQELNTVAKVEQCLEGIKKLFRSFIVEQAISKK